MGLLGALQIAGAGMSLLGAFKGRNADQGGRMDLGRMRDDAKKYGVNFLTLLNATGGAGYTTAADRTPAMFQAIGDSLGTFAGAIGNQKAQDAQIGLMNAQRDMAIKETGLLGASRAMSGGTRPTAAGAAVVSSGVDRSDFFTGPTASYGDQPWVNLWTAAGTPMQMRQGLADRFSLANGGTVIQEDMEGVLGDVWSEFQATGMIGDAWYNGVDIFRGGHGADTNTSRNPFSPLNGVTEVITATPLNPNDPNPFKRGENQIPAYDNWMDDFLAD